MSLPQFVQASPRKSRKSQVEPYERNHGELAGKHNPSNASAARRKQQVGGESWRRGSAIPPAGDAEARIKDEVDDFLRKTAGRHTNKDPVNRKSTGSIPNPSSDTGSRPRKSSSTEQQIRARGRAQNLPLTSSTSSIPHLPSIQGSTPPPAPMSARAAFETSTPTQGQVTVMGTIIKVGASHKPIPTADLKRLRQKFDVIDVKNTGVISWDSIEKLKGDAGFPGAWSQKLVESKQLRGFKRRGSVATRITDRLFNFKDVLRLMYPDVAEPEVALLDELAQGMVGMKLKVHQYSKPRQEAARQMYERTCQDDGQAFLGDLEDLLFTRFPEFNQYRALKLLGEDVLDRLYDDEPIRMEEFCMWFLKLEDQEAGRDNTAARAGKSKKILVNPGNVFGSYLRSKEKA
mmetsp:Transcript_12352/g.22243  ORF Transcript_12352/g.22243 Transcript_12352/m.22243 type:complete len:403 (-) Transcript_12352:331-1539(-)|eukprot:CAMPEP_0177774780 /NCGR_PEP_ID=MMETSP0491_2-20121128/13721_1 /TAXON_ID=63592 /ORGANISM="Tetraselmis chuii, Strain PLY429" /LENGTH=402 /DNA_ID=CAMNT_0019293245 /DNA_START=87 /DNA_END=1295 /DNA_ORIENTATION=+